MTVPPDRRRPTKTDDFAIIAVMLLVDAGLDFFQERRILDVLRARTSTLWSRWSRASSEKRSHFQQMLIRIGHVLILTSALFVGMVVVVSLFRHEPPLDIARFALVLTVAATPVAPPAVLSATMAVSAPNLARHQAIASRLTAIEEFAGIVVLRSDKTGTLTRNETRSATPFVLQGRDGREMFLVAAHASKARNRDPIARPIFDHITNTWPDLPWQARPCHGRAFDLAGRVVRNAPAPTNLEMPDYRFTSPDSIVIGT